MSLQTGLVEETMCRALVLVAMILAWGNTRSGQIKAIILSSLFFSSTHLINLMIRPIGVVLMQAVILSLPGVLYAALVLTGRSLWPPIVIHWLTNSFLNLKLHEIKGFQETSDIWVRYCIILIPLMIFSFVIIRELPIPYKYADMKQSRIST